MTRAWRGWGAMAGLALALCALAPSTALAVVPGPDGRIAFASDRDGDFEIYTVNPDGSDLVQVTRNTVHDRDPSWSPDGKQIAFESSRDGNSDIYRITADGSTEKRVTFAAIEDHAPAWGPAGTRIAFTRGSFAAADTKVILVDVETGGATTAAQIAGAQSVAWSPSGGQISITRNGHEVFSRDLNSSSTVVAHEDANLDFTHVSYSPDGKNLLIDADKTSSGEESFIIVGDGEIRRLFLGNTEFTNGAAWSPSGDRIVYSYGGDLFLTTPAFAQPTIFHGQTSKEYEPDWATGNATQPPGDPNPDPGPDPDPDPDPQPLPGACANHRTGTAAKDKFTGGEFGDLLRGGAGDDTLIGAGADDCLFGDSGDDKLKGGVGNDRLDGGKGHDTLAGGTGVDSLAGGKGNDRLVGEKGTDSFSGGDGNDSIDSRDGKAEKVKCGGGKKDVVTADKKDKVSSDCEKVKRK